MLGFSGGRAFTVPRLENQQEAAARFLRCVRSLQTQEQVGGWAEPVADAGHCSGRGAMTGRTAGDSPGPPLGSWGWEGGGSPLLGAARCWPWAKFQGGQPVLPTLSRGGGDQSGPPRLPESPGPTRRGTAGRAPPPHLRLLPTRLLLVPRSLSGRARDRTGTGKDALVLGLVLGANTCSAVPRAPSSGSWHPARGQSCPRGAARGPVGTGTDR